MPRAKRAPILNRIKCSQCRIDKQKCEPFPRRWPEKCDRCKKYAYQCSEGRASKDDAEAQSRRMAASSSTAAPVANSIKRVKVKSTKECFEDLGYLGLLLRMLQDESIQMLYEDDWGDWGDGLERLQSAFREAVKEAKELVDVLHATGKPADALAMHQRLMAAENLLFLPVEPKKEDLERLVELAERQEDFAAAEECQERVLALAARLDPKSDETNKAAETLFLFYERSANIVSSLVARWGLNHHPWLVDSIWIYLMEPLRRVIHSNNSILLEAHLESEVDPNFPDSLEYLHLTVAAAVGHQGLVEILLKHGANVNGTSSRRLRTAIMAAAAGGHEGIVKLLIRRGGCIETKNFQDETALHLSASCGHEFVTELLIKEGADMEFESCRKERPLHKAARNGEEAVVRLLIGNGAEVNAKTSRGGAPLHFAVSSGHAKVVELLIDAGADMTAADDVGDTALHMASGQGDEALNLLLIGKGADVNARTNFGRTPLSLAVRAGREKIVGLLIEGGADLTASDNLGYTALHFAAEGGHEKLVRLLVDKGANIWATNGRGKTALQTATDMDHASVVRLLTDERDVAEALGTHGYLALHKVVEQGRENVALRLIGKGVGVNFYDHDGRTALHLAALAGQERVVQMLLEKGADVSIGSLAGGVALVVAAEKGHEPVVRLLLRKGDGGYLTAEDIQAAFLKAVCNTHVDVVQLLIESGADATGNAFGYPSLPFAIDAMDEQVVRLLLESGADARTMWAGQSMLHQLMEREAPAYEFEKIVRLLLDHGADVTAKNSIGNTPLEMLAKGWGKTRHAHEGVARLLIDNDPLLTATHGNAEHTINESMAYKNRILRMAVESLNRTVVKLMIEKGADIDLVDQNGYTALHKAIILNKSNAEAQVRLLLEFRADVNVRRFNGVTSLMLAIYVGNEEAIKTLLRAEGIDVNAVDFLGNTALMSASNLGRVSITELLLTVPEIDIYRENSQGDRAWNFANSFFPRSLNHVEITRLLETHATRRATPFHLLPNTTGLI